MRPNPARRPLGVVLKRVRWTVLALLAGPSLALADPIGYASGFNELYSVDVANGQAVRIGGPAAIGFNDVEGLAFAGNGELFGVADASRIVGGSNSATTDFLFTVSPLTGVGSLVGQLPGLQGQGTNGNLDYGLAFTCDGRLWLSSETTRQLWEVNPSTATVTLVGVSSASISGLAARGNDLYGISVDPDPGLYRIDTATAASTLVGTLDVGGVVNSAGLDFDAAGTLWASLDPVQVSPTRIARVDPATGRGTLVSEFSTSPGLGMRALAIAPPGACGGAAVVMPEPVPGPSVGWLALLAAFAALFAGRRLRRQ